MISVPAYKKCYKCGYTTTDLSKKECKCGGFLYTVSSIYTPQIKKEKGN